MFRKRNPAAETRADRSVQPVMCETRLEADGSVQPVGSPRSSTFNSYAVVPEATYPGKPYHHPSADVDRLDGAVQIALHQVHEGHIAER